MEPVRLQPECMQCLLRKYMDAAPAEASRREKTTYLQNLLSIVSRAPLSSSAPILMEQIDAMFIHMFHAPLDYSGIKRHFNRLMLEQEDRIAQKIVQAEDPLRAAVQYAMTGNYIDFGALDSVTEEELSSFLDAAEHIALNESIFTRFCRDIKNAARLVFMTDNCGEIVMDKLLLRVLQEYNPRLDVSILVRGGPVLNDATIEDAQQVGLDQYGPVLDTGRSIAGVWLEALPHTVRRIVDDADVILAKGQGNFETLNGCGLNVYYLFLCKCDMFAHRFSVPKFTGILANDRVLPRME